MLISGRRWKKQILILIPIKIHILILMLISGRRCKSRSWSWSRFRYISWYRCSSAAEDGKTDTDPDPDPDPDPDLTLFPIQIQIQILIQMLISGRRCKRSSAAEDAKTDPDPDPDPGPDSDTDPDSDAHQRQKMQKVTFGICQRAISADWTDIYLWRGSSSKYFLIQPSISDVIKKSNGVFGPFWSKGLLN